MRATEKGSMLVIGLLVAGVSGANGLAESPTERTEGVAIRDEMLVASDRELRERVEEIVFLRGVVDYSPWAKNPVCRITTSYGTTYKCAGIEKYAGDEVILAVVPRLQPKSTGPSDPVETIKSVSLVSPRVLATKAPAGSVNKLATSHPPATIQGKPGSQRATWDRIDPEEQERVHNAANLVARRSEELWSDLVAHLDDDRYSMTVGSDAGYPRNRSIGDLCQDIIGETLSEAYFQHLSGRKEIYHQFRLPDFAKDKLKLREWCVARKDRKLFELQIAACEWAITEIQDSDMSPKEKQSTTTAIKKVIDELTKSRVAIPCPRHF